MMMCWALLCVCRALLSVCRALLSACRDLLSVCRALLNVRGALLNAHYCVCEHYNSMLKCVAPEHSAIHFNKPENTATH